MQQGSIPLQVIPMCFFSTGFTFDIGTTCLLDEMVKHDYANAKLDGELFQLKNF